MNPAPPVTRMCVTRPTVGAPAGGRDGTGAARGLTPHPLFQPDYFAQQLDRDVAAVPTSGAAICQ